MEKILERLADFIIKAEFSDLHSQVVHEMKRVVLDSLGIAILGHSSKRGRIAIDLARDLSGKSESTIIGTNYRVPCTNAAFVNGELMNALDFDAVSRTRGLGVTHDTSIVIPAVLALAERVGASGEDFILALALGFEISGTLRSAVRDNIRFFSNLVEESLIDFQCKIP